MTYTKEEMQNDFRLFLNTVWESLNQAPTEKQKDIVDRFFMDPSPRRVLLTDRAVGKTSLNVVYGAWKLFRDPASSGVVISHSTENANRISSAIEELICSVPMLSHLTPVWSKARGFRCPQATTVQASVVSFGFRHKPAGLDADWAIVDDIETYSNAQHRTQIIDVFDDLEMYLRPGGEVVVTATPVDPTENVYMHLPLDYKIVY